LFKLVIRRWLKQAGASSVPAHSFASFQQQVQYASSDSQVAVRWDGWLLHLYKRQLWLQKDMTISSCPSMTWSPEQTIIELGADIGQIELQQKINNAVTPTEILKIGSRSSFSDTGIKLWSQHRSVKNLFQEASIPPWLRDCVPICQLNGELVALGDWCISKAFAALLSENKASLKWSPGHPLLRFIHAQQHQ